MKFRKLFLKILLGVGLFAFLFFFIFGYLDVYPLRIWDESRLAMNALEMFHNHQYFVTYFDGKPDMWNTKPPLMIWFQVFFLHWIGQNELAIRLPSALAAFGTCILLFYFCISYLKNWKFAIITVLVLVSSSGFIDIHSSRTGDYDSLLTLFTTAYSLLFFSFTVTQKSKHLYLFFLFLVLACLTKGISGLFLVPALLIYSVFYKKFVPLLKNKHLYFGILGFLVFVLGYYGIRELQNPGYLKAVWENELGGRYLYALEGHGERHLFYFMQLMNTRFSFWFFFIPLGIILGLFSQENRLKQLSLFAILLSGFYLIFLSFAKTKIFWYDLPAYPFLAILVCIPILSVFQALSKIPLNPRLAKLKTVPSLFLILLLLTPFSTLLKKTAHFSEYPWEKDFYAIGYILQDALHGKRDLNDTYIVYGGYCPQNLFYIKILQDKGVRTGVLDSCAIQPNSTLLVCQETMGQYIVHHFYCDTVRIDHKIITYQTYERK